MEIVCRHSTVNPRLIDGDGRTATGGQSDNSTLRPRRQDDDCAQHNGQPGQRPDREPGPPTEADTSRPL